jgi:Protein of unknown function (DUF3800)
VAPVRPSSAHLFRVYVDEAGNRFISPKSDNFFVVSAVIVHDEWKGRVTEDFCDLKMALGRLPEHRLHFSKLSKLKRVAAARGVAQLPIAKITSVIVSKDRMGELGPAGDLAYIADPDPMYLWALRLLLERISWFVKAQRGRAIVTFSHLKSLDPRQIHEYRVALESGSDDPKMTIEWPVFADHSFRVDGPKKIELLQLADTAASSTYHAVQPGADGVVYLKELKPKLYRGTPPRKSAGLITKYGLKVFPDREATAGGQLAFLRQF